jgi:hypothetical protein
MAFRNSREDPIPPGMIEKGKRTRPANTATYFAGANLGRAERGTEDMITLASPGGKLRFRALGATAIETRRIVVIRNPTVAETQKMILPELRFAAR